MTEHIITGCVDDSIKQKIYKEYIKRLYAKDGFTVHMTPVDDYILVEVTTTLNEKKYHKCRRKSDGEYDHIELPGNDR